MRKPIALLLVLLTVISVAGCGAGNGGRRTGDNPNSVNDVQIGRASCRERVYACV